MSKSVHKFEISIYPRRLTGTIPDSSYLYLIASLDLSTYQSILKFRIFYHLQTTT